MIDFCKILLLFLPLTVLGGRTVSRFQTTPIFSDKYYVEGLLSLPYAEIKEPFTGYYDGSNGRSRVDYYGDLELTIQRADVSSQQYGTAFKLAYMVNHEGDPHKICFQINGTSDAPVTPQTVLPDLSLFTNYGDDNCPDTFGSGVTFCERWEYAVTYQDKENKYVFWLKRDEHNNPIPVHYSMKGYDTLLGSHYDKYEIAYKNYKIGTIDPKIFDFVANLTCRGFPGPGMEHIALNNPIKEFVTNNSQHITDEFDAFKEKHGKEYDNKFDHKKRENIFMHNYRYIMSKNRKNVNFKLSVNHFADLTDNEMRMRRGRMYTGNRYNGGVNFDKNNYKNDIPDQWDWRLVGGVTPVKDQAVCGSCWSFGTTGTIEGAYFVKTGHLVRLSQQQLIDCSWNEGDNGCDGGEDSRAYDYIMKVGGIATEEEYGPYLGADGKCHDRRIKKTVQLSGFYNVTPGDADALKVALYNHGPVTVAIDASHKSLSFYSNGIYYESQCGSSPENLDHQVLAVGYGTLAGEKYWLIKNSWSTYWGNDGYVLMNQKDNNCGVLTQPTFPIIDV